MSSLHGHSYLVVTLVGWTQSVIKHFSAWRRHCVKLEAINPALGTIAAGSSSKAAGIASDELGHGDRLGVYNDDVTRSFTFAEVFNGVSETDDSKVSLGVAGVMGKDGADQGPPDREVRVTKADMGQADSNKFGVRDLLVAPDFTMRKPFLQVVGHGDDESPEIW